jgi:hypothetical protein
MFIGMAFNERNDAFDFNTSLEDAKREREAAKEPQPKSSNLPAKDYSIKEGEKIRVKIKNIGGRDGELLVVLLCLKSTRKWIGLLMISLSLCR